jgi:hypothetical protein
LSSGLPPINAREQYPHANKYLAAISPACLLFTSLIMSLDQWIESKLKEK